MINLLVLFYYLLYEFLIDKNDKRIIFPLKKIYYLFISQQMISLWYEWAIYIAFAISKKYFHQNGNILNTRSKIFTLLSNCNINKGYFRFRGLGFKLRFG
jgi:hypothetical protein